MHRSASRGLGSSPKGGVCPLGLDPADFPLAHSVLRPVNVGSVVRKRLGRRLVGSRSFRYSSLSIRTSEPSTETSLPAGDPVDPGSRSLALRVVREAYGSLARQVFQVSTLTKWLRSTRLETRTKESNMRASVRVANPCAQRKRELGSPFSWGGTNDRSFLGWIRVRAFMMGPERW
jgi:hypothetical protein